DVGGVDLDNAQQQQQNWCGDANGFKGRQYADEEGGQGHQDNGQRQNLLASQLVAQRAPDQAANRADQEGEGEGGQSHEGAALGGEEVGGDIGDGYGVDTVVEPFCHITHGRSGGGLSYCLPAFL